MKKSTKMIISLAVVLFLGGTAYMYSSGSGLEGMFGRPSWSKIFPGFTCGTKTTSIVVSEVPSEVTSSVTSEVSSEVSSKVTSDGGTSTVVSFVTSEVSSWVTSMVSSKVPQCVPFLKIK